MNANTVPIISFLISSLAGSFSLAKFFVSGPIPLVSKTTLFNGLGSVNFVAIFLLCLMCILRMISLEAIFFSHYARYNSLVAGAEPVSVIPSLLPPQMRLLVYLAPALITMSINFVTLARKGNFKKTLKVLKHYPQVIMSPGFTPFFFTWQTVYGFDSAAAQQQTDNINYNTDRVVLQLTICKRTSLLNAMAIGCLPQAALIVSLLIRGVYKWDFFTTMHTITETSPYTTSIFPTENGEMIFSLVSLVFCSVLIAVFFKNHKVCHMCGLHCIFKNLLCCPCPDPCLDIKPYRIQTEHNPPVMQLRDMNAFWGPNRNAGNAVAPANEIYLYHGSKRIFLLRKPPQPQLAKHTRNDEATHVRYCETYICFICAFLMVVL